MNGRILFIHQDRSDAIGITDRALITELQKQSDDFDFLKIAPKGRAKFTILWRYFANICKILWKSRKYKTIYFSYENPYILVLKIFSPKKHTIMCVHHLEKWAKTLIGKEILARTDTFIAISEFTKNDLVSHGVDASKVLVNYNGVSSIFYPEKIKNFQEFPYILHVGSDAKRKNLQTLFETFDKFSEKYPNIHLVKIGNAGGHYNQKNTEKIIKNLKNQDKIHIIRDRVDDETLRKWYSNALLYTSVSELEGFGLTVVEAMRCQTPVVASSIPPFVEICGMNAILVDAHDNKALSDAWERVITDEQLRDKLVADGFHRSLNFLWKQNAKKLINYLKNFSHEA